MRLGIIRFIGIVSAFSLGVIGLVGEADATTDPFTPKPKHPTVTACEKWAAEQTEDNIYMWGQEDDGTSSEKVAMGRLTDFCMGNGRPDIVFFGSSAGYDIAFCKKHPEAVTLCAPVQGK